MFHSCYKRYQFLCKSWFYKFLRKSVRQGWADYCQAQKSYVLLILSIGITYIWSNTLYLEILIKICGIFKILILLAFFKKSFIYELLNVPNLFLYIQTWELCPRVPEAQFETSEGSSERVIQIYSFNLFFEEYTPLDNHSRDAFTINRYNKVEGGKNTAAFFRTLF